MYHCFDLKFLTICNYFEKLGFEKKKGEIIIGEQDATHFCLLEELWTS